MPAKSPTPEPDPTPAVVDTIPEPAPAPEPEPDEAAASGLLPAGTYAFVGSLPTQYLHVPLTAYPASNDRPATVFDWAFGAPPDGRWEPTRKKQNQQPDNAPADPEGD
jgi:hypothetical protein